MRLEPDTPETACLTYLVCCGFHPFSLLFLASGSLMISTIRVPKP